jgi:3'(2'), 5'-bisphosphate nucleotidase
MSTATAELLEAVARIAQRAGTAILGIYTSGEFATRTKEDATPLTAADLAAHRLIVAELGTLTPDIPVLSEESAQQPFEIRRQWARHWLVDPLDGTREFLARNGEFTVNIALIEAHAPVLGVVHVPVADLTYAGLPGQVAWRESGAPGQGAGRRASIAVSGHSANPVRCAGSRSHRGDSLEGFLARLGPHVLLATGSSRKFCAIAEGLADVYPRLGPTSEWDTAAGHAVLLAAGGNVCTLDGGALCYNTRAELTNPHFIAYGPKDRDWLTFVR